MRGTLLADGDVRQDAEDLLLKAALGEVLPALDDFYYPHPFHPSKLPVNVVQGVFPSDKDYYHTQYGLLRAEYFSNYIHGVYFKKFADRSALHQLSPTVRHGVENGAFLYGSDLLAALRGQALGRGLSLLSSS